MTHFNALKNETSPYLLQHADNPVHWYPWSEEALQKARDENRPILLSIGYSACHWCHVMAHESFEDEDTAALMNEYFINIKVDREERPDLDRIYQTAHQLLTRRNGGWPLTVFLTPDDHLPFFAGTYFPPQAGRGMPGFRDVMQHIHIAFNERMDDIRTQNAQLQDSLDALQQQTPQADTGSFTSQPLADLLDQAGKVYDARNGGFGHAPKFPHPGTLLCLLRTTISRILQGEQRERSMHMILHTLQAMAQGGMNDQLGGGFCRYSVDEHWMIPHFEKMLYDNGPMLSLYSQAWQITADPLYLKSAEDTADWAIREMQDESGGFYSSIDADSEGEEGRFYVWGKAEVRNALDDDEYPLFAYHFGLDTTPNFEGHWHLHVYHDLEETAAHFGQPVDTVIRHINSARGKLLAIRNLRSRPGTDDKILCSWNALMIRGLCDAGRILQRDDYLAAAERALHFIHTSLWNDGRLYATSKDGHSHLNAYLDDYAYLLDAVLVMLESRWNKDHLAFACEIADALLGHFEDTGNGGFFFTSHDHEKLIQRSKSYQDDALPAGNGVAAVALSRLGHLLGRDDYLKSATQTVTSGQSFMNRHPMAHNALLIALAEQIEPATMIILRGEADALAKWQTRAMQFYAPGRYCLAIPAEATSLPEALAIREPRGEIVAYICQGQSCAEPMTRFDEFDQYCRQHEVSIAAP